MFEFAQTNAFSIQMVHLRSVRFIGFQLYLKRKNTVNKYRTPIIIYRIKSLGEKCSNFTFYFMYFQLPVTMPWINPFGYNTTTAQSYILL